MWSQRPSLSVALAIEFHMLGAERCGFDLVSGLQFWEATPCV
jgi:hypothetical protein